MIPILFSLSVDKLYLTMQKSHIIEVSQMLLKCLFSLLFLEYDWTAFISAADISSFWNTYLSATELSGLSMKYFLFATEVSKMSLKSCSPCYWSIHYVTEIFFSCYWSFYSVTEIHFPLLLKFLQCPWNIFSLATEISTVSLKYIFPCYWSFYNVTEIYFSLLLKFPQHH